MNDNQEPVRKAQSPKQYTPSMPVPQPQSAETPKSSTPYCCGIRMHRSSDGVYRCPTCNDTL